MNQQKFYTSIAAYYESIFPLNKLQTNFVKDEFGALSDLHFLDAGCSTGQLANDLTQEGALGIGIDLNPAMIGRATSQFASPSLSFREMNMLSLSQGFPQHFFDSVICFGNTLVHLETITQVRDFFTQCAWVLKPGGKLLLQILNYQYIIGGRITDLPLIDNDHVRFERHYVLPDALNPKIEFNTALTIKADGVRLENSTLLLPLRKVDLEPLLQKAGFSDLNFYDGFNRRPFTGTQLPLVVSARRS